MAALGIVHPVGEPRRLVATFDDVGLPVAVEVGQRRGRKVAVRREPGEPGQGGPAGRVDGVLFLAQRWRHRIEGAVPEVAERQRGPNGRGVARLRVAGRVFHGYEPALGAVRVEGLVTAGVRSGRVADTDEHGVIGRGVGGGGAAERGDRGCRIDGYAARPGGPARHGPPVFQRKGIDITGSVSDDHGWLAPESGDVGRGQGDGMTRVRQGLRPDPDEGPDADLPESQYRRPHQHHDHGDGTPGPPATPCFRGPRPAFGAGRHAALAVTRR